MAIKVPTHTTLQREMVEFVLDQEERIDGLMRAMWDSRSMTQAPATDEKWAAVKKNRVHQASLGILRQEAIEMLENDAEDF